MKHKEYGMRQGGVFVGNSSFISKLRFISKLNIRVTACCIDLM